MAVLDSLLQTQLGVFVFSNFVIACCAVLAAVTTVSYGTGVYWRGKALIANAALQDRACTMLNYHVVHQLQCAACTESIDINFRRLLMLMLTRDHCNYSHLNPPLILLTPHSF
jgi:hypothetical protein